MKVKAEADIKPEPSPHKPIGVKDGFHQSVGPAIKRETRSSGTKRLKEEDLAPATPPTKKEAESDGTQQAKKRRRVKAEAKVEVAGLTFNSEAPTVASGPFPNLLRPTPAECRAARDALAALHGEPQQHKQVEPALAAAAADSLHTHSQRTVLDSLVRTVLSQNTTDVTSHRAFARLKESFPTWEEVLEAPSGKVEESIRQGGLAEIKTQRIKAILATLQEEQGKICLEYLRGLSDEQIKTELTRFKGVGKKTIACVLMFCLAREEFPVDTHVWRISKKLGWVPEKASRDAAYEHLNIRVPADVRYDLHVLLVEHGKRCPRCASNGKPRKEVHGDCPLVNLKSLASELQDRKAA